MKQTAAWLFGLLNSLSVSWGDQNVHLVSRKKLNHRGAVATIVGLPLAILLACTAQANAGSDTVNVRSSNQSGGITAYQVNIMPQHGAVQPGQSNKSLAYPDKELLAITPKSHHDNLQPSSYVLTVPVYQSVPASLTWMRAALKALKATFGTEATLGYITATFGSEARQVSVMPDGTSIDQTTIQATRLNVSCIDITGGAEALCREIQRRYEER